MRNKLDHARYLCRVSVLAGITIFAIICSGAQAFAQSAGPSWSFTGSLNVARSGQTATRLPNGKVLVAGGRGSGGCLASAELYDPATGTWSLTGSLSTARCNHTATLLQNGKVLVVGGFDGPGPSHTFTNSAELYDPVSGTWGVTSSLNVARVFHTATLLQDGKVLVAGGHDGEDFADCFDVNSAELYDPVTGTWSFAGALNQASESHTATLLQDGSVLVAGGCGQLAPELYNPATGTWKYTGNLVETSIGGGTATLLPNGKVLVSGGWSGFSTINGAQLYDPATGTWSFASTLNTARDSHTATLLPNGQVLIVGGVYDANLGAGGVYTISSAELFDPATGLWSSITSLNTARSDHTATLLPNGKVLIAGGFSNGTLNSAELYNPGANSSSNPIDDAQFFVRQQYRDFLNRDADPDGLAFWTSEIVSCGGDPQCIEVKRINVSAAYFLSIEFQQTGYLVYRTYKAAYGNLPDGPVPVRLDVFLPDTEEIEHNVIVNQSGWQQVLENNKQAFEAEFVQRDRFTSAFPSTTSADDFVDKLNQNAGNPLSQMERDNLVSDLSSGVKTRAEVLRAVAEAPNLVNAEFNRAFVLMQYFGYLRRDPNQGADADFSGYSFWLNKLNTFNGDFVRAEMVKAFIESAEYRQRFVQ